VEQKNQMAVSMRVTNTSRTIDKREEGTDLTSRLSLPVQRKRKRHLDKQNDEQSARLSAKQRRGLVTGMSDQRAAVRPQQIQT
jgi:hypothetical protein